MSSPKEDFIAVSLLGYIPILAPFISTLILHKFGVIGAEFVLLATAWAILWMGLLFTGALGYIVGRLQKK